jgi:LPXTG-motif cell wall-anchored protein
MKKIIIFFCLLLLFNDQPNPANALLGPGNEFKEVGLDISPNTILFNTSNMKPGDSVEKVLEVQNNGKEKFHYIVKVIKEEQNDKLYNELELDLFRDGTIIYSGKLNDIKELKPIILNKQNEHKLLLKVAMPYELGNEFQGLTTEFKIKVVAQLANGTTDPPVTEDKTPTPPSKVDSETNVNPSTPANSQKSKLPNTATNIYNLLLIGTVLMAIGILLFLVTGRLNRKNYNGKR